MLARVGRPFPKNLKDNMLLGCSMNIILQSVDHDPRCISQILQWTLFTFTLCKSPVKYLLQIQVAEYCLFSYKSETILEVLSNMDFWKS